MDPKGSTFEISRSSCTVNLRKKPRGEGVVKIQGLTVENPQGYWSTHLLHVGELLIDLDMQAYITSMGKHVVIAAGALNFKAYYRSASAYPALRP